MIKIVLILALLLISTSIYIFILVLVAYISNLWDNVKTERKMMEDEKIKDFLIRQIVHQPNSSTAKFIRLSSFFTLFLFSLIFTSGNIFISIFVGAVGLFLPQLYLKAEERKKISVFEKQLPKALIMMRDSLKSGFNIYQALEVVIKDMKPPISAEFEKVIKEVRLGASLSQAIENLNNRVNSKEMDFVAKTLILGMQSGGKIAEILDKIAAVMKEREKFNLKVKAMTTQGRLSAIVVGIMPFVLFVALFAMQPEMMVNFISQPLGIILMVVAVVLVIIGLFVVKKTVEIRV